MPDELFDMQLVRALAYARQRGADVGECVETGRRIARADPDRWFDGWFAPAARVELTAEVWAEHGLAACVSDCGPYEVYDAALARIPGPMARQVRNGSPAAIRLLERVLNAVMARPSAGWALRRKVLVHGVDTPMAFFDLARVYTLKDREHLIRCPTFVCSTRGDDLAATAETSPTSCVAPRPSSA